MHAWMRRILAVLGPAGAILLDRLSWQPDRRRAGEFARHAAPALHAFDRSAKSGGRRGSRAAWQEHC